MHHSDPSFRKKRLGIFVGFLLAGFLLLGAVVMCLWNFILAEVIPVKPLAYWQALGILLLSRILFGGFRFGRGGHSPKNDFQAPAWKKKWAEMSEEEKQNLKNQWKEKCRTKPSDDLH